MILLPILLYSGYIFSFTILVPASFLFLRYFYRCILTPIRIKYLFVHSAAFNSCRITCKTTEEMTSLFVNCLDQRCTDGEGTTLDKNDIISKPDMSSAEKFRRQIPPLARPSPHGKSFPDRFRPPLK